MKIKNPYINTLINKVSYAIAMFLANALITRALGSGLKGEYTYYTNLANIFAILLGGGIYQSIPFFNRQNGERVVQEYLNIFSLQFIFYSAIILLISIFFLKETTFQIVMWLILLDIFSQQLNMLLLIDNIYVRNKIFVFGAYISLLLSVICFFVAKENLDIALLALILSKLICSFLYLISFKRKIKPFDTKWSGFIDKVKFGYVLMLSYLMITLNYKVDVLMLRSSSNISAKELSFYSTGVTIAELAWFIPDVFKDVLFSKTAKKNNYDEIALVIRVLNFFSVGVILGILFFGKFIITIIYGLDFLPSYEVTVLLFWGIPAMSWFKIINTLVNAQGKRILSFLILFASTLINVIANFVFIPFLGIYGAAIASIASYSVCGIVYLILFSKMSGYKISDLIWIKKSDIRNILNKAHK